MKLFVVFTLIVMAFSGCRPRPLPVAQTPPTTQETAEALLPQNTPLATAQPVKSTPQAIASSYELTGGTHTFQTFNNCGPAAMSMALSYYGISKTQQELGQILRPYQHPRGDNDDKSVTLAELAALAPRYNLIAFHRPAGSIDLVEQFVANEIPVVTRTWLRPGEDIGHYRVIKGYDRNQQKLLQDDSLQGKNLWYSYDEFKGLWQAFNFEFVVFVKPEQQQIAQRILGELSDEHTAWQQALENAQRMLVNEPNNTYAMFNQSVAQYYLGNFQASIQSFEEVESRLPPRMLWYQIEPILAYHKLGEHERVLALMQNILSNHNRAFSELYQIRGEIFRAQGDIPAARREFELAVQYKSNYQPAIDALAAL